MLASKLAGIGFLYQWQKHQWFPEKYKSNIFLFYDIFYKRQPTRPRAFCLKKPKKPKSVKRYKISGCPRKIFFSHFDSYMYLVSIDPSVALYDFLSVSIWLLMM